MTQEFVAESVGVSRQAVSKWENGTSDPSTSNLCVLAKLYGVSPEELLKAVENMDLIYKSRRESIPPAFYPVFNILTATAVYALSLVPFCYPRGWILRQPNGWGLTPKGLCPCLERWRPGGGRNHQNHYLSL